MHVSNPHVTQADTLKSLTEGVHTREALDMVKDHVKNVMGPAAAAYANTMLKMSKLQAAQVRNCARHASKALLCCSRALNAISMLSQRRCWCKPPHDMFCVQLCLVSSATGACHDALKFLCDAAHPCVQVYAASIMFGYFVRRVDNRFQLERGLGLLDQGSSDAVSRLERLFSQVPFLYAEHSASLSFDCRWRLFALYIVTCIVEV